MSSKLRMVLIVIGSLTLAGVAVCGGAAYVAKDWWDKNGATLIEESKKAGEEGRAYASLHDQNECIKEASDRAASSGAPRFHRRPCFSTS